MKQLTRFICLSFFSLLPFFLFAQWHDAHWFFGYYVNQPLPEYGPSAIDFLAYPVEAYEESEQPMNFNVTEAIYSDFSGALLYYTNGCYIRGADFVPLLSCDSLNPETWAFSDFCFGANPSVDVDGYPKIMYGFFLPQPECDSLLYLFHSDMDPDNYVLPHIYYTRINRNLDGGRGDCDMKNMVLLSGGDFGTIAATKHANGRDWWLVIPDRTSNSYHRFLFSSQGISEEDTFFLEPEILLDTGLGGGIALFSPSGELFVRSEYHQRKLYVYDFDRCTGTMSNGRVINFPEADGIAGIAISPNSRFLYQFVADRIFQYDLWVEDIESSLEEVGLWNGNSTPLPAGYFMAQLAPDGKIYISSGNGAKAINCIANPNAKGEACDVRQPGIYLPHYNAATLPYFPNYRLGPIDGSSCDTLGLDNLPLAWWRHEASSLEVDFTDNSFYEPTSWYWDFGDGHFSMEVNPVHVYEQGGVYDVCLTVSNAYGSNTLCRKIRLQGVGVTATSDVLAGMGVRMYPNPLPRAEVMYLEFSSPLPLACRWKLYDANGRSLAGQALAAGGVRYKLLLPGTLPGGLYFWTLEDSAGRRLLYGKVVVQ